MSMYHGIELSYHPLLSGLLALPVFRGSQVLGGRTGLDRPVTGVNLTQNHLIVRARLAETRSETNKYAGGFCRFDDLGLLRLIYASDPDHEIADFVRETLGGLIDPCLPRTADLLVTLESYFRQSNT